MSARRLRVSREAENDLVEIAEFTSDRWGDAQAQRYLRQLDERLRMLCKRPESGRAFGALKPGYWRALEGRHVVYYVFSDETLDVIRILHERMLPERHL